MSSKNPASRPKRRKPASPQEEEDKKMRANDGATAKPPADTIHDVDSHVGEDPSANSAAGTASASGSGSGSDI